MVKFNRASRSSNVDEKLKDEESGDSAAPTTSDIIPSYPSKQETPTTNMADINAERRASLIGNYAELTGEPIANNSSQQHESKSTGQFPMLALGAQVLVLGLFFGSDYNLNGSDQSPTYNFYVGICLMMFVGFGYLMTFLKSYGLGAVGFTAFITCLGLQWAVAFECIVSHGLPVRLDLMTIINGLFCVAAILISFGALIGKTSPTQLCVLVLMETVFYCVNKVHICEAFGIQDVGGTIVIHVFGAYFGLACSFALGKATDERLNAPSYNSDLFSLIGTVFLWLYWPSFVAGVLPPGDDQTRALINTILGLVASTVVTFVLTPILSGGKIAPVPIQNATLAGGVAMGATANLNLGPFGALLMGCIAGGISCFGFCRPLIASDTDTCGINNLHGMPGLFGGLVSVVVPFLGLTTGFEGTVINAGSQMSGLVLTLVVSLLSGYGTGLVLKAVDDKVQPFNDAVYWETAEDITKAEDGNPGKLDA